MKVIIAGSRTCDDYDIVDAAINNTTWRITEVVSGAAKGVDQLGEKWAVENIVDIKQFPANWEKHGKSAGMIRNLEMAKYADSLIAVWDGKSNGTKHMILDMMNQHKPIYIHFF